MIRRSFLGSLGVALASIPFVGKVFAKSENESGLKTIRFEVPEYIGNLDELFEGVPWQEFDGNYQKRMRTVLAWLSKDRAIMDGYIYPFIPNPNDYSYKKSYYYGIVEITQIVVFKIANVHMHSTEKSERFSFSGNRVKSAMNLVR